jgi:hypothetical protein
LEEEEQKGLKEGLLKGLTDAVLMDVQFGRQQANQVKNLLGKIDDIKYLKKIKKEAIKAQTWNDFILEIQDKT